MIDIPRSHEQSHLNGYLLTPAECRCNHCDVPLLETSLAFHPLGSYSVKTELKLAAVLNESNYMVDVLVETYMQTAQF